MRMLHLRREVIADQKIEPGEAIRLLGQSQRLASVAGSDEP